MKKEFGSYQSKTISSACCSGEKYEAKAAANPRHQVWPMAITRPNM